MKTFATVLRTGGVYSWWYVWALQRGLATWYVGPSQLLVLTDDLAPEHRRSQGGTIQCAKGPNIIVRPLLHNLPGWWSKMELFNAEHDDLGEFTYFDLDTVIVRSIQWLDHVHSLYMLEDFYRKGRLASGMMHLPIEARQFMQCCWPITREHQESIMRVHVLGDQSYMHDIFFNMAFTWQKDYAGRVVSYKKDLYHGAGGPRPIGIESVVCFHGSPKPHELLEVRGPSWMESYFSPIKFR